MKVIKFIIFALTWIICPAHFALAQFQGDVFFKNPSVSVPQGGTTELEVLVFTGADVIGATHLDILFEPSQAEVVVVEPGEAKELKDSFVSDVVDGKASVVNLNDASLTSPIGTVSLARLLIRPFVPAGSLVTFNISVRSLLNQNSIQFSTSQGFSAEVLVVSGSASVQQFRETMPSPRPLAVFTTDDEIGKRALALRRPGAMVDLLDFYNDNGYYSAITQPVVVSDPATPQE